MAKILHKLREWASSYSCLMLISADFFKKSADILSCEKEMIVNIYKMQREYF